MSVPNIEYRVINCPKVAAKLGQLTYAAVDSVRIKLIVVIQGIAKADGGATDEAIVKNLQEAFDLHSQNVTPLLEKFQRLVLEPAPRRIDQSIIAETDSTLNSNAKLILTFFYDESPRCELRIYFCGEQPLFIECESRVSTWGFRLR